MTYLPIYLELKGRRCLIVGGGEVAARRALSLLAHEADVEVVAPEIVESLRDLEQQGKIQWNPSPYESRFMSDVALAIAATDDALVNDLVASDAHARRVLVCRVDRARAGANEGDFIFPGVLERGDLTISVATLGGSPTLTSVLLDRLAQDYGPEWSTIVELCKTIREDIKTTSTSASETRESARAHRKAGIKRILADEELRKLLNDGKILEAEARARECLSLSWE